MSESFTVDIHAKMRSLPRLGASASRLRTGTIDVSQAISIPLLIQCNQVLMLQSFLHAPSQVGLEDTVLFKKITDCPLGVKVLGECTSGTVKTATYPHLVRWYRYMQQFVAKHGSTGIPGSELGTTGDITPKGGKALDDVSNNNKAVKHGNALPGNEENKLVLPGAEEGKVVTRFPPEASGFMHIGHAKAALINSMLRDKYKGKMIFRFDDTNPAKEKESYEHSIIHDLAWIGIKADVGPTYTSDYFDTMLTFCGQMLKQGTAYVDFTPVEEMRRLREAKLPTPCREHSIEENCRLWEEMKKGSEVGQTCCVRAKIDVESLNGTMRDPTMYRVVLIPHARTGTKYKVYPTYDFACPIVDSIEGVTHALRTVEYRDRNEQYYWFVKTLQIRRPELDDYSRLNMEYTVMSKRKLALLVDEGVVDGWDDPRFPTVRALCRRGLYPEALRQFVEIQGMSKVVNVMEWSKLWVFNTKLLEHEVPRYTAVSKDAHTVATVEGEITTNVATRLRHKKNESLGTKPIHYSDKILLESADVALLREGDEITLMDWGNAFVSNIQRDASGRAVSCSMRLHLEGDVRKTKYKLNWLAENAPHVVLNCYEFDNILTVKKPDPEDPNFDSIVNRQSKFMQPLIGEGVMKEVRKGDRFQIERRGYYIVDSVEESHLTLFAIPDGSTKINHLSAKAAAGFTNPVESSGKSGNPSANNNNHKAVSGKTLEEKRAEKAALKAAQKKSSTNS